METCIGYVTHYYNHLGVAVLSLSRQLKINDTLHFLGHSSDFYQRALSMEIDHHKADSVDPGAQIGFKVVERVHKGDMVLLVIETTPEETREILFEQLREWEK